MKPHRLQFRTGRHGTPVIEFRGASRFDTLQRRIGHDPDIWERFALACAAPKEVWPLEFLLEREALCWCFAYAAALEVAEKGALQDFTRSRMNRLYAG